MHMPRKHMSENSFKFRRCRDREKRKSRGEEEEDRAERQVAPRTVWWSTWELT